MVQLILKVLSVLPAPCPPAAPLCASATSSTTVDRKTGRRRCQDADLADPDGRCYADLGMRGDLLSEFLLSSLPNYDHSFPLPTLSHQLQQ